jgi:hypothetical protein
MRFSILVVMNFFFDGSIYHNGIPYSKFLLLWLRCIGSMVTVSGTVIMSMCAGFGAIVTGRKEYKGAQCMGEKEYLFHVEY